LTRLGLLACLRHLAHLGLPLGRPLPLGRLLPGLPDHTRHRALPLAPAAVTRLGSAPFGPTLAATRFASLPLSAFERLHQGRRRHNRRDE